MQSGMRRGADGVMSSDRRAAGRAGASYGTPLTVICDLSSRQNLKLRRPRLWTCTMSTDKLRLQQLFGDTVALLTRWLQNQRTEVAYHLDHGQTTLSIVAQICFHTPVRCRLNGHSNSSPTRTTEHSCWIRPRATPRECTAASYSAATRSKRTLNSRRCARLSRTGP
jgi:hypothetical protein